jgi:hypothetical protein
VRRVERKVDILLVIYTSLVVLSVISLYVLGERRIDAYISLNILAYYTSHGIIRPNYTSRAVKALNIALFAVFMIIVAFRVYEVLVS